MSYLEKINISVPLSVKQQLDEDAALFEIYKKDGETINRNHLLNRVICGYYYQYIEEQASLMTEINNVLLDEDLTNMVMTILSKKGTCSPLSTMNDHAQLLSLKPTKKSAFLIDSFNDTKYGLNSSLPKN